MPELGSRTTRSGPSVVGVDLSSKQIDLARLEESRDVARHTRVYLDQLTDGDAWTRTLLVPFYMPPTSWWDEVYLVAIEAPYGSNQGGTQAILNRVVGAIAASLPSHLRVPERCWIVRPDEWKRGLGLKAKPTADDLNHVYCELSWSVDQDARDALALALWARDTNARAIAATLNSSEGEAAA